MGPVRVWVEPGCVHGLPSKPQAVVSGFTEKDIALEFYQAVRCGLMHEAQTKRRWTIWAKSYRKAIIDRAQLCSGTISTRPFKNSLTRTETTSSRMSKSKRRSFENSTALCE